METINRRSDTPLFRIAGIVFLTLAVGSAHGSSPPERRPYTTWSDYAGSADSMQYSALTQIDRSNVRQLELVWHYPLPEVRGNLGFNPVIVDGVMYVVGRSNSIVAMNAATGEEVWSHPVEGGSPGTRGINYWESEDRSDRRLIFGAGTLRAINALTGEPIASFGSNGRVNVRTPSPGSPRTPGGPSPTAGRTFENLFITGSSTGEGYFSPVGDIRAYDVITGELVWTFRTIPLPGEFGYETWPPEAWRYVGAVNCWGEISIDTKRGIAYVPLGSPSHDMYGGDRSGAGLFGNSLVALDARTGRRLWHFQAVHHDLWDYDLTTAPKLMTVRHKGELLDIVAQATKFGLLYVFDRVTGEPLWPIEEVPVPQSDVPGEQSYPTQPFPTRPPPYGRLHFPLWDINPYLDEDERARIRERLSRARNEGVFTPQTLDREQISVPGENGGANAWGGTAADPETGMLYVRNTDQPAIHRLRPAGGRRGGRRRGGEDNAPSTPQQQGRTVYSQICVACHGELLSAGIASMDRTRIIPIRELGVERLRTHIRQGQGQMPAFTEDILSEESLQGLLAYLVGPEAAAGGRGRQGGADNPARDEATAADHSLPPGGLAEPAQREVMSPSEAGSRYYSGPRFNGPLGAIWRASNGLPVSRPPWAEIIAYDLNEGIIKWRAPLGTVPALAAQGITDTGSPRLTHRNGLVVTAGGLIFVGSWGDRTFRALDKDNGKVMWEFPFKGNPEGIPAVYEVDGRQFVVFCASGRAERDEPSDIIAHVPGLASTQGYYVFALPGIRGGE